ncbi:Multidrug resistance protein MdtA precursor [Rubripirellula tenax]|uniref:Multidrug resistance protein MdtA n=1 Tax=Rubripirellula tenax TaxID=2528015 RepID=A0A5C6FFM6_9BACT|nr:HlyD family efflux transporter periplasmic adaptor subunit [Rubripirellula tenax]TWU58906.1 Multidrug resistance protein MdtA precursor [Rubripirellula tenax]
MNRHSANQYSANRRLLNRRSLNRRGSVSPKQLSALTLSLATVVIAAVWIGRSHSAETLVEGSESPPATSAPLPVGVVVVGVVTPDEVRQSYSGMLVARRESQLGFDRPGRVVEVMKEEGDRVTQGECLACIATDDLDASEQRTRADLESATALLDELIAGPRKESIEAARAKVASLAANRELSKANTLREEQLAARDAGSVRTLDEARFGQRAADEQWNAARAELRLLEEGTRKEQVAAQRAVCDSIRGELREIEADRRDSRIEAPFDGLVRSRFIDEGAVVTAGEPILHWISLDVEGRFGIPAAVADSIKPADQVSLRLRTTQCTGTVVRVEPYVDLATRTRAIYVRPIGIESSQGWIPGEVVDVELTTGSSSTTAANTYWLPTSSLTRGGRGVWTVLAVPGTAAEAACEKRAVELLRTDGDLTLVQGMLSPGDRVIVDGMHRLTAGMRVAVIDKHNNQGAQP